MVEPADVVSGTVPYTAFGLGRDILPGYIKEGLSGADNCPTSQADRFYLKFVLCSAVLSLIAFHKNSKNTRYEKKNKN